jgi:hypothetical protein
MTIFLIDVHETVHTCPAEPAESHPIDTRRTLVSITPGGPCRQPAIISLGDTTAVIPCRLRLRTNRQCVACRHTIWIRTTTVTDLGFQGATGMTLPPPGYAAKPCPYCHTPVAAYLGVHLLCGPNRRQEQA